MSKATMKLSKRLFKRMDLLLSFTRKENRGMGLYSSTAAGTAKRMRVP